MGGEAVIPPIAHPSLAQGHLPSTPDLKPTEGRHRGLAQRGLPLWDLPVSGQVRWLERARGEEVRLECSCRAPGPLEDGAGRKRNRGREEPSLTCLLLASESELQLKS